MSVTSSNTVTPAKKTRMSPDSTSPQVALPVGKRTKSLATTSTVVTAASIDLAKTQNPKHTHETGTGRASFQVSSDTNAERDKSRKGSPNGNTEPPGNPKDIGPGFTREYSRGYSQSSLSIASLNVKNLSKSHNIIILQEHWLYGFESSLAQQIYNNSNFHIKCVDDLDPIPPVQPPRGHAGTCILWENDLNHCIKVMPDGGHRVTAVEITGDRLPLCLINVYMPSRGCPDSDIQFQSTLDEVHEILEKNGHTHKILLGVTSTHHYTEHNFLEGTNCCKPS